MIGPHPLAKVVGGGLVCLLVVLGGCGGAEPVGDSSSPVTASGASMAASAVDWAEVPPGPWHDEIASWREGLSARHDPGTEFVKRVLADGVIAPEEYEESLSLQAQCLREAGLDPVVAVDEAGYRKVRWTTRELVPGEPWPDAVDVCSSDWDAGIQSMYYRMHEHPDGEPTDAEIAACLVHEGLVPEGFTAQDWIEVRDLGNVTATCPPEENPCLVPTPSVWPNPTLPGPGGHLLGSEEVAPCIFHPRETMRD